MLITKNLKYFECHIERKIPDNQMQWMKKKELKRKLFRCLTLFMLQEFIDVWKVFVAQTAACKCPVDLMCDGAHWNRWIWCCRHARRKT